MFRFLASILLPAAVSFACGFAHAQALAPRLSVSGESANFAPAVAFFDAAGTRVSLLYAHAPLSQEAEIAGRAKGSWSDAAAASAPAVVVDLRYAPGSTTGLAASFKGCSIISVGFKKNLSLKGATDAECHVLSVGGLLREGGAISGLLTGKGAGYSLTLPFSLPLPAGGAEGPGAPGGPVSKAEPGLPLNTVRGTGKYQGQTLNATHALAWWAQTENQVRVEFFDHPPSAGMLAAARKGEYGEEAPVATLYVGFKGPGRELASATYCFVNVTFPKGGPMGTNTTPAECGLTTLVTNGKPGGTVQGVLKGGMAGPNGPIAWDIQFHVPIAK